MAWTLPAEGGCLCGTLRCRLTEAPLLAGEPVKRAPPAPHGLPGVPSPDAFGPLVAASRSI